MSRSHESIENTSNSDDTFIILAFIALLFINEKIKQKGINPGNKYVSVQTSKYYIKRLFSNINA